MVQQQQINRPLNVYTTAAATIPIAQPQIMQLQQSQQYPGPNFSTSHQYSSTVTNKNPILINGSTNLNNGTLEVEIYS